MTQEEIKALNIFERMSMVTAEIGQVDKDLQVGEGKKSYRASGEGTILAAVKPLEEKYRIYSYPISREKESAIIEKEYTWNGERRMIRLVKVDVTVRYRFVNIDKPDEFVEMTSYGTGIDTGDKAPGKAMTYADKYALMKAYKIFGGNANDPDAYLSPEDGFVFGLADMPSEDNPLDFSLSSPETIPPVPDTTPSNPVPSDPVQPEPPTQVMSLSDAQQVVMPIGTMKGHTMGEILATKPSMIDFYAGSKFNSDKYPYLREAAQIILAHKAQLK